MLRNASSRKAKGTARSTAPRGEADDPRVAKLIEAFRADPTLAPVIHSYEKGKADGRQKFGSNGLSVNGKLFALFTQGTLVVKLPKDRVAELVATETGIPFDPGHGRRMKEWLTVSSARALSWVELAREAHDFVSAKKR